MNVRAQVERYQVQVRIDFYHRNLYQAFDSFTGNYVGFGRRFFDEAQVDVDRLNELEDDDEFGKEGWKDVEEG